MKKYLIVILLSCICNLSNARNWDMLKPDKRWNILQVTESKVENYHDSSTYYVKFDLDTIINTRTYRRVFRAINTEFNDKRLNGYVREDSNVGLYYRNLQGEEGLLYKYNLHLGDTVFIQNRLVPLDSIRYLVTKVDSILIDSKYKKRYIMAEKHHELMPETWVEGVGSSIGILGCGVHTVGGWTQFLCCYDNNVLIYKNPDFQNCYYYYSTRTALQTVKNSESGIKVYSGAIPNDVFIKSQVDNYIKIYNSYGIIVETIHVLANQEYRLNVSKYPKGIYIISPSTNLSSAKKFIRF